MTTISREDCLRGLVALDLHRQGPGADLSSAELRAAQKLKDADAFTDVAGLVDPWRRSPSGPAVEAEKFLKALAGRLGIDVTRGFEGIASSIESAIQASVKLDADPGAWGQPQPKKWSMRDTIAAQCNALRGNKAALAGAFTNAIAAAAQRLKDLELLQTLEQKAAFKVPLTSEHRGQLLEVRERFRADFTMAVEDPNKATQRGRRATGPGSDRDLRPGPSGARRAGLRRGPQRVAPPGLRLGAQRRDPEHRFGPPRKEDRLGPICRL